MLWAILGCGGVGGRYDVHTGKRVEGGDRRGASSTTCGRVQVCGCLAAGVGLQFGKLFEGIFVSFLYIRVASAMHDAGALSAALGGLEGALAGIGGVAGGLTPANRAETPFYFVATGGVENDVMRHFRSRMHQGQRGPALLIAHPGHNSLPAAMEILAQVRQEGETGRIYFLRGAEDGGTLRAIGQTARCLAANQKLAGDRLGVIGPSSDWLVASSHRSEIVGNRFGMRVVQITLDELRARIARDPQPPDGPEYEIWESSTVQEGVSREAFARAVGVYRGLRALVEEHRLTALTLRCFDLVTQDATTGCLALARLAAEGITAGCEGDIPSVVLLRWLWHLSGEAGWMANVADMDASTGEMCLAHCTVPLCRVKDLRLMTHFESGLGVGLDGTFSSGPVTILRLGGAQLELGWGAEGEWLGNQHADGLCRTQARIQVAPAAIAELLRAPLGNHVIMIPGKMLALFQEALALNLAANSPRRALETAVAESAKSG